MYYTVQCRRHTRASVYHRVTFPLAVLTLPPCRIVRRINREQLGTLIPLAHQARCGPISVITARKELEYHNRTSRWDVGVASPRKVRYIFLFICLSRGLKAYFFFFGCDPHLSKEGNSGRLSMGPYSSRSYGTGIRYSTDTCIIPVRQPPHRYQGTCFRTKQGSFC